MDHLAKSAAEGRPIMLVEDEPENQLLVKSLLAQLGVPVVIAKNGVEALKMVEQTRPRLILMDITMPVMDGLQALEKLQSDPATKDIPVVMLTSSQRSDQMLRAYKLGAIGYILKPLEVDSFLDKMRSELGLLS